MMFGFSQDERLEALDNAIKVFDHNDIDLHNIEIEAAADVALVKHLVFINFKSSLGEESMEFEKKDITQEIGSALECLECGEFARYQNEINLRDTKSDRLQLKSCCSLFLRCPFSKFCLWLLSKFIGKWDIINEFENAPATFKLEALWVTFRLSH